MPEVNHDNNDIYIRDALKAISAPHEEKKSRSKFIFITLLILAFFLIFHLLLQTSLEVMKPFISYKNLLEKGMLIIALVLGIILINNLVSIFLVTRITDPTPRFYVDKVIHFLTWLLSIAIIVSAYFSNWTTLFTSLGLISIIVGIALQAPVSNFFAWIILIVSPIYRVGDRIKINDFTGDVIDVGYFYTTLWEFGGEYISNDLPSGRIIILPNSLIFTTSVYNYSWPLFPYIWTEVEFYISYDSDFVFVEEQAKKIANSKIGIQMKNNVSKYRKVLASTPVDDVEVKDEPRVFFVANSSTWIKASVRFLCNPKEISQIKKELLLEIMQTLLASPEKVGFPDSNTR